MVHSTTERIVEEKEGKKVSQFRFVRFRDYKIPAHSSLIGESAGKIRAVSAIKFLVDEFDLGLKETKELVDVVIEHHLEGYRLRAIQALRRGLGVSIIKAKEVYDKILDL